MLACLALALGLAACGDGDSTEGGEGGSEQPAGSIDSKPEVVVPEGEPPSELVTEELIEGDGAEAKAGDEVTVEYVGVGYQSKEEFDASWGREPFTFVLGAGNVIAGWDEGVVGMKEGGRRELIIPSDLAYGPAGSPPVIGPDETLIFIVDLVSVG